VTDADFLAAKNGPFSVHVTSGGERWDQIADQYYGDPLRYEVIIAANPSIGILPILDGGLQLLVPVLPVSNTVAVSDLPPWKQ
jgi:nucleoid-associated protein YgaU